jgi:methylenetetrahydrofolate dehydrogenase (NADP+)/methenyltetrahydrofolate cyclohydrolase
MRAEAKERVTAFVGRYGYAPVLAAVLAGGDEATVVYFGQILRSSEAVGLRGRLVRLEGRISNARLRRTVEGLDADPEVAGIIVQVPLPKPLDLATVVDAIDPGKDVDGLHPLNAGLVAQGLGGFWPATAEAAVEILVRSGIALEGRRVAIVGRSNVVGKPAALLLQRHNATVTMCHSRTRDLAHHLRDAEIVVVAAGRARLVTGDMLAPGAVVVDVGINVEGETIVGDVDFASASRGASAITPVPGGVGPLTCAVLITHTVNAAYAQAEAALQRQLRQRRQHRQRPPGLPPAGDV